MHGIMREVERGREAGLELEECDGAGKRHTSPLPLTKACYVSHVCGHGGDAPAG